LLGVLLAVAGLPSVSTSDLDDDHVLALSGAAIRAEDRRVLDAFARELQASVEVGALEAEAGTVGALAAVNELRAALLSAVSHDLRTPISAIKASVTSLLQRDVEWTPSAQHEFLTTIDEETDRLNALVGNLLDMSRLQSGALEVRETPVGLEQVLPAALRSIGADDDSLRSMFQSPCLESSGIRGCSSGHKPEGARIRRRARRRARQRLPLRRELIPTSSSSISVFWASTVSRSSAACGAGARCRSSCCPSARRNARRSKRSTPAPTTT
jgi:hypothetical protein